ncbi:MAG: response regulator [Burkholderiales bacterium]|nr:MAG: response regulator [Burkholderiales bacterium]
MTNEPVDSVVAPSAAHGPATPRTLRGVLRWLLIAPLVPLALVSGVFVWTQLQANRDTVYAELARDAGTLAAAVDQEVEIGRSILGTLAASELIDRRDWEGFRKLSIGALNGRPDTWIALGEVSGLQVMRTFEPVAAPTMNPNTFARQNAEVAWRGRPLPVSTQGLSDRVIRGDGPANTGLYFGAAIRRPAVAIGVPVMREGRVTHVLIMGFAPDRLAQLFIRAAGTDGPRAALVDAEGRVIAASHDSEEATGRIVPDALRQRLAASADGIHEGPDSTGEQVLAAYRRTDLTDWSVAVAHPRATAFSQAWRAFALWSALLATLLAVSAWTARSLWLRLAPPLVAMGRAARQIQQGRPPELPSSGVAEIEELGALLREAAGAEARNRDETLRRAVAEEAARAREASERLLRRVLDNVHASVAVLDAKGRLLEANLSPVERSGLSRAELIGVPFWDEPWWSHDETMRALVRDAVGRAAAGETVRNDVTAAVRGGAPISVDLQIAPLRDESGAVTLLIVCGVDVTERERTAAALREADRQKDEFLAILSHELRNPLAPIRAASHVIRQRNPQDPALAMAGDVIERQVRQLVRLVDDLLEVSRITQGRIELQRGTEPLAGVVGAAIEAARPAIEAAGHRLSVTLPERPLVVEADAARLSQAILNVLNNAARYTPRGGHIAVRVERDGAQARVSIEDDGIGIDAETLPRIFEMFVQGDRDAGGGGGGGGLGIGLALARRLVEMHGGTIRAWSDGAGRGSRFEIALPCLAEDDPRQRDAALSAAAHPADRRRVLVVDDNVDAATTLQISLELDGHEVRTVHDGLGALEAVAAERPDAVLLDIGLPDIDGLEVARRLRARYGRDCPRLIAVSGWGQEADKRRAAEAGFERHFTKPVEPSTIAEVLAASPSLSPSDEAPARAA